MTAEQARIQFLEKENADLKRQLEEQRFHVGETVTKIRELRIQKGLTQKQVADALSVSRPAVIYWEQGKTQPSAKYIKALSRILKCKVGDLLPESVT